MTSDQGNSVELDFEQVVEAYWDEILAYLWRLYSGAPEAEDRFQDTFLRAFKAYPQLEREANVRAWLYRIATNVARTDFKRSQNRLRREQVFVEGNSLKAKPTHEKVHDNLLLDQVIEMVGELPGKQRAAFMLRKYQGCSYAEIGVILECTEEAARANVYQALRKLKAQSQRIEAWK